MQNLPPEFRPKHDQLLNVVDTRTGKPVTDSLGRPSGLQPHPSGGARYGFAGGGIYSFDSTGRYPVVAVWGNIHRFYDNLANFDGGFGRPLTDVTDLEDGGRCCIFEGGHLHEYGQKVEPFPASHCVAKYKPLVPPFPFDIGPAGMPTVFHQKWVNLSLQKDPNGQTIVEHLGRPCIKLTENPNGGQLFNFLGGDIISLDNRTLPVVCYGPFVRLWRSVGGLTGGLGHPLTDPQDIEGGRCQIFQGGHIHDIGGTPHTCSPDQCALNYQAGALSWNTMPPHFQRKFTALCSVVHPHTRETIVEMFGPPCLLLQDNPNGLAGQDFNFLRGDLVSLSLNPDTTPFSQPPMTQAGYAGFNQHVPPGGPPPSYQEPSQYSGPQYIPGLEPQGGKPLVLVEPFYVTGVIATFWKNAGGIQSTYGRPLCDEQDLPDGGRCGIFEGAHIHLYSGEARGVPASQCTAPYQPTAPPRGPNLAPWPAQPAPHPQMSVSQGQMVPEDNVKPGGCMSLLKMCCKCSVETYGRGGVCKIGECVCCTWTPRAETTISVSPPSSCSLPSPHFGYRPGSKMYSSQNRMGHSPAPVNMTMMIMIPGSGDPTRSLVLPRNRHYLTLPL